MDPCGIPRNSVPFLIASGSLETSCFPMESIGEKSRISVRKSSLNGAGRSAMKSTFPPERMYSTRDCCASDILGLLSVYQITAEYSFNDSMNIGLMKGGIVLAGASVVFVVLMSKTSNLPENLPVFIAFKALR